MITKLVPGIAPDGNPILSVLGKETFVFKSNETAKIVHENPIDFYEENQYYGDGNPINNAVHHESDLVAYKPFTDVIFHGKAYAPEGKKAKFLDVSAGVNEQLKKIRVFGNRRVVKKMIGFDFTEPEPFSEMPLHYGLAYGGKDLLSDEGIEYVFAPNPIGKGYLIKSKPETLLDLELPNLEDPENLLTTKNIALEKHENWHLNPKPMSFGYTGRNFYPRLQHKHHLSNGASDGLQFPYLNGDEFIRMKFMDPFIADFKFKLPGLKAVGWLDTGNGPEEFNTVIHTIEVFKPTHQVTIVWRGFLNYGGLETMNDFGSLEFGMEF